MARRKLGYALTEQERKEFYEFLNDRDRFERMVDEAVRGMWTYSRGKRAR